MIISEDDKRKALEAFEKHLRNEIRLAPLDEYEWKNRFHDWISACEWQASRAALEDKWMPIESAPKDGHIVIVWCHPWTEGAEARYVEDEGWYLAQEHPSDSCGTGQIYPTRWQYLPPAPKESV